MSRKTVAAEPVARKGPDLLGVGVALFTLIGIGGVYGIARLHDAFPAGHPASGFMWTLVGLMTLRSAFRLKRAPRYMYWITLALVIIGLLIWLATTLHGLGIWI
jgi:membrane-associated PAP2 superfamily phosphatase